MAVPEPDNRAVSLMSHADVVKQILPGADLIPAPQAGVRIRWVVMVDHHYDFATNAEHAEMLLTELCERVRIVAMRELGIDPIMNAMKTEVRNFQQANAALTRTAVDRAARILALEEQLDKLRQEHDDEHQQEGERD